MLKKFEQSSKTNNFRFKGYARALIIITCTVLDGYLVYMIPSPTVRTNYFLLRSTQK